MEISPPLAQDHPHTLMPNAVTRRSLTGSGYTCPRPEGCGQETVCLCAAGTGRAALQNTQQLHSRAWPQNQGPHPVACSLFSQTPCPERPCSGPVGGGAAFLVAGQAVGPCASPSIASPAARTPAPGSFSG